MNAANAGPEQAAEAGCARCGGKLSAGRTYLLHRGGATQPRCLSCALRDPTLIQRSLKVALVVGTLLNLGNQGMALFDPADVHLGKALFTYLVPYGVAMYGALSNARA